MCLVAIRMVPGPPLNKELCSFKAITRSKKAIIPGKLLKGTSAGRRLEFRLSVGSCVSSCDRDNTVQEQLSSESPQPSLLQLPLGGWCTEQHLLDTFMGQMGSVTPGTQCYKMLLTEGIRLLV
jgi:hypothetical protein